MRSRARQRAAQRGVTLIELMVVVGIVAILATTAVVVMNNEPSAKDIAHRLSGLIGEASRLATAGGPRNDGGPRTRVEISGLAGSQIAIIERWDDVASAWQQVSSYEVASTIDVVGFRLQAETTSGATPNYVLASGDVISLACSADGSCLPDSPPGTGLTIYLREVRSPSSEARVVVLRLGGTPLVYDSW